MQLPEASKLHALEKQRSETKLRKKKESEKRLFLIEQRKEEYRQSQIKDINKAEEAERERRDTLWADAVEHGKLTGEVNMSWQKVRREKHEV